MEEDRTSFLSTTEQNQHVPNEQLEQEMSAQTQYHILKISFYK